MTYTRNFLIKRCFCNLIYIHTTDAHLTCICSMISHDKGCYRTLSTSGLTHKSHKTIWLNGKGYFLQNLLFFCIPKLHLIKYDFLGRNFGYCSLHAFLYIEQSENLIRCRISIHCDMEK